MSQSCDGYATVYRNTRHKARKDYRCCACKEPIQAGHLYHRVFIVFDGSTDTFIRCLRCEVIHSHLVEKCQPSEGDLWPDEQLSCGLDYEEEWGPLPDEIAELAFVTADEMQAAAGDGGGGT